MLRIAVLPSEDALARAAIPFSTRSALHGTERPEREKIVVARLCSNSALNRKWNPALLIRAGVHVFFYEDALVSIGAPVLWRIAVHIAIRARLAHEVAISDRDAIENILEIAVAEKHRPIARVRNINPELALKCVGDVSQIMEEAPIHQPPPHPVRPVEVRGVHVDVEKRGRSVGVIRHACSTVERRGATDKPLPGAPLHRWGECAGGRAPYRDPYSLNSTVKPRLKLAMMVAGYTCPAVTKQ